MVIYSCRGCGTHPKLAVIGGMTYRMGIDVKLILTDIDGTILPYGQRQVSKACVEAFRTAIGAGIHIGPASGRGQRWMAPLLGGDEVLCATALASNGMEVYLDGKRIHAEVLDRGVLRCLAQVLRAIPGTGLVCFDDATPLLVAGSQADLACCFAPYAKRSVPVDDVPDCEVVKANVFFDGDISQMHDLADRLGRVVGALSFDVPQAAWLNVMTRGWGKGPAIDVLCERLGIDLTQVAVFGDGGNDVSMLSHVPLSFAVAGASADALAAAHHRIGACEDDAVAAAIEALAAGAMPT